MFAGSAAFMLMCFTSCGFDPKTPSEGNFRKAIDEYLAKGDEGKVCLQLDGPLPFDVPRRQDDTTLKLLEGAGLLRSSDVMARTGNHIPGFDPGPEHVRRYEATDAGRKVFTDVSAQFMSGPTTQACWANLWVDTVVKWSTTRRMEARPSTGPIS
jgi:hypothetical protein